MTLEKYKMYPQSSSFMNMNMIYEYDQCLLANAKNRWKSTIK